MEREQAALVGVSNRDAAGYDMAGAEAGIREGSGSGGIAASSWRAPGSGPLPSEAPAPGAARRLRDLLSRLDL